MAVHFSTIQVLGLISLWLSDVTAQLAQFELRTRFSVPTAEMKPLNTPQIRIKESKAAEKFELFEEYYKFTNSKIRETFNPQERKEMLNDGMTKLFAFIDKHLEDIKRLLISVDKALLSMATLKLNKKMDASESKIKQTQAMIPFGIYISPEFKCLGTSYYIASAHNEEDAQMILSSERKPHCYTYKGAFQFGGFFHRNSESIYVGPHHEIFTAKDPTRGLYCAQDPYKPGQCIYKINPREEFPESVEYEPKISYHCGPYRYFVPPTTDVRCIFSMLTMSFVFRIGFDGVAYQHSDLSFTYQNGQTFYTDEPWAGMSCWNWACKWRHNQNGRLNDFALP